MALTLSTDMGNKILNKILKNTSFTSPATVYVSLHTSDPGLAGTNEVSGGSYARKSCAFDTVASKATQNAADISFTSMPAATLTHVGLWDASSSGNFVLGLSLATSKSVAAGDTFKIAAGDLDIAAT